MRKISRITTAFVLVIAVVCSALPVWVSASAEEAYESTVTLMFENSGIEEIDEGEGYTINGKSVQFSASGVYTVTGSCDEGSITVKKGTTGVVLILSDLTLANSNTAPLVCNKSTGVTLYIKGTVTLTDNEDPAKDGVADEFEGAAIKTKSGSNLIIEGDGELNLVGASCKNGIKGASAAAVTIDMGGTLNVSAANNAIASDGSVVINRGKINVTAGNEGIKSEPDTTDTASAGTVTVNGGTITVNTVDMNGDDGIQAANGVIINGGKFDIDVNGDAIQSYKDITINNGTFDIKTLDGYKSANFISGEMSCKGLKASATDEETENAQNTITVSGGTFVMDTADDAIHSDGYVIITGGTFEIQTGDDGVHADTSLTLGTAESLERDPYITIKNSCEGLEAGNVYIYGGKIFVYATNDGINAAGGSQNGSNPGNPGGHHFNPGGGPGGPGGPGGWGTPSTGGDYSINVYGGNVYVDAQGDGLDSNGTINLEGGNIEVWGQSSGDNSPLDSDGALYVKGATVFAAGCTGMGAANPKSGSQTYKNYSVTANADSIITVNSGSADVYAAKAPKSVSYEFYSSPDMTNGYTVFSGSGSVDCHIGSAFVHDWDKGTVTTPASETETGVKTFTCKVCGETERQTIPMITSADEEEGGEEEQAFKATFVHGENVTIDVYYKQSYEQPDETGVTEAAVRNSDSGEPDISGNGQVNFAVNVADGYEIDEISIEGGYKNLKDLSGTDGVAHLYRITKITGDITVTVTVKEVSAPEVYGDLNRDGEADNKDVVLLFRYLSGAEGIEINEGKTDINNDGETNNKDVTVLFRYLSSEIVSG